VNTAGEQNVIIPIPGTRLELSQQNIDHGVPQNKACPRANVTAAFPTFKDESPGTIFDEHAQEPWRRNVQVCGNSLVFERARLIWASTGDQCVWGPYPPNDVELLRPKLGGDESKDADSPGSGA
jgi:hypothetical protein